MQLARRVRTATSPRRPPYHPSRSIAEWLGSLPAFLPLPLPPASPPARLDLCHALCVWLLVRRAGQARCWRACGARASRTPCLANRHEKTSSSSSTHCDFHDLRPFVPSTQTCWHLVLPLLWALVSDARARQAFLARRRAADELPVTERAWWAGLVVPPVWLVPLAAVPVLSLALWRLAMVMLGP